MSMFQGNSIQVRPLTNGLVELCIDRQGESVNALDARTLDELREALVGLQDKQDIKGLLVTSAKKTGFVVGADLNELAELRKQDEAEVAKVNGGQAAVFSLFESLPFPTLAEINGWALGGGFELALACDYRVMSTKAQVGLPETGLGLFPGLGGSVRLPRLIAESTALDWILSARNIKPQAALDAGAVNAVVEPEQLRDAAIAELESRIAEPSTWQARRQARLVAKPDVSDEAFAQAKETLKKTSPHVTAYREVIELIERSIRLDRDQALTLEREVFARVLKTQAAASLIQIFHNQQHLKRKGQEYGRVARKVERIGVLGAGIMGGGIAYTSAVSGIPSVMKDIAAPALDLGMSEADKLLGRQVESGRLSAEKAAAIRGSITPTLDYDGFDTLDVIVEAVVENMSVKRKVLADLENSVRDDAVIASNTSSLSITEMASGLKSPERFAGMHFFNPVPVMPLVEVIRGPQTSDQAAATVAAYAIAMGKTPILVQDCPGFLVNRILTAYILAFLHLIKDGADFAKVDEAMQSFGWPMGPAYLQDVIGMDTAEHVIDHIAHGFGDRLVPGFEHAVACMVQHQRLGQKNGKGFYHYERDPKGKPKKTAAPESYELIASLQAEGPREFSDSEIVQRMMLPMIIEAAHCLEENVADGAIEIDMALILGIGLPRHLGGPLKYCDWVGMARIVEQCEAYQSVGKLYEPTARMREMARSGGTFY